MFNSRTLSKAVLYAILATGLLAIEPICCLNPALAQTPPIARLSRRSQSSPQAKPQTKTPSRMPALVPPPPPLVPLAGQAGPYATGAPISFQSEADLKKTLADLNGQLTAATEALDKKSKMNEEKQERAKLFDDLYKEGVVSRRELEAAHKDAEESQVDLKVAQAEKDGIQTDFDFATKELSKFAKAKESKTKTNKQI